MAELSGIQDQIARDDAIKAGVAAGAAAAAGAAELGAAGAIGAVSTSVADGLWAASAGGTVAAVGTGLMIQGNNPNTTQLSLLKDELDAADRLFIAKSCGTIVSAVRLK
jgi:hypothetical protein